MQQLRLKEEQERIRALPPKEREEVKKVLVKATGECVRPPLWRVCSLVCDGIGRQLFERGDPSLLTSDAAFDEEGAEEVDASQYERPEGLSDDEDEGPTLGEMSDSD
jgi:hypothetical protein